MPMNPSIPSRRRAMLSAGRWVSGIALPGLAGRPCAQMLQSPARTSPPLTGSSGSLSEPQQQWRALSRLGYGPHPLTAQAIQSSSDPKAWAIRQLVAAQQASLTLPVMQPDVADIAAPLPQIFDGARLEREARARLKADNAAADPPTLQRLDFSAPPDPLYFNRSMIQKTAAWRLRASCMPAEEDPVLARMTEFWFNHFNVYIGKGAVRPYVGHYLVQAIRRNALGKFEDLLMATAQHPAMLLYLDQAQSVAEGTSAGGGLTRGLNENYARELLELHTLGVDGGYTQSDVRELARLLTGWTVSPKTESGFQFLPRFHDNGAKRVLGQTFPKGAGGVGEIEGEMALRMLARHPSTARRLCQRMARFFVADEPATALVARLSTTYLESHGDLLQVMLALVQSPDFWAPGNTLFKTPLDYACSALTATQSATDRRNLLLAMGFLGTAGQPLHGWQTPDGYPTDARTWMAPEALTRRADFALALGRQGPDLAYLERYLGDASLQAIAQARPNLRAGLLLSSPEFMTK